VLHTIRSNRKAIIVLLLASISLLSLIACAQKDRWEISKRLPCTTTDGQPISYDIIRLGALDVTATAHVIADNHEVSHDISAEIAKRQRGEDRPFTWNESFFDMFVGSFKDNPLHRNWAGSDLSGRTRISPGGVGNVNVPCTDFLDCVAKKHDIQYWIAKNFELHCHVKIFISGKELTFLVENLNTINSRVVFEMIGLISSKQRRLLGSISQ
jgi:hypothetical protein